MHGREDESKMTLIGGLVVVVVVVLSSSGSSAYETQGARYALTLDEFLQQNPEVDRFMNLIRNHNYFNNTLHWKSGTLFVPNNTAVEEYLRNHYGRIDDNTLIYHFSNIQTPSREMDEFVSSDLPRNPPIWVTSRNSELFLNDARVVKRDLRVRIGSDHIVHTLDQVLIPTVPNSASGGSDLNNPDAKKFLGAASAYNTSNGYQISDFVSRVATLKRLDSYHNVGKHTFFIPVNNINQRTNLNNVDNKVIDGHIIPGQILFLSSATLNQEIQTLTYISNDPALAFQNFPIFISIEKLNRTDVETWNVVSENRIDDLTSGTRYRKGKVHAEIVRGNIPVRNGVIHLIKRPLVIIDTTIYEVLQAQGNADGGQMYEFFRIIDDFGRHTGIYEMLQRRDGRKLTLFVPTNEAVAKSRSFVNTLTNRTALTEILKLHIVEEELPSDYIYNRSLLTNGALEVFTTRPDWKLHFTIGREGNHRVIYVQGGGTSGAAVTTSDIGATNGVIHMINRVLGIEDQTMFEKLRTEYMLESTFRLSSQNYYNEIFKDERKRFTFFAPSNAAWDKFSLQYPLEHSKLFQGGHSSGSVLDRHLIIGQEVTIEELKNYSSSYGRDFGTRELIPTYSDNVRVASVQDPDWHKIKETYGQGGSSSSYGELDPNSRIGSSNYYGPRQQVASGRVYGDFKYVILWHGRECYVVRPNIKTTNGIIHIIDYPFIAPSDVVAGSTGLVVPTWILLVTIGLSLCPLISRHFSQL